MRHYEEKGLHIDYKEESNEDIAIENYTFNESTEDTFIESYVINEKDIYYNKDKFDSGEINLCFITGHSGSGKSTMGRNLQDDIIEHYDLDDLQCVKDYFSMDELKNYGDLIYSFFNGAGKKFYKSLKELEEEKIPSSEYEDKLYVEFVKYAMKYAKSHKDKKYVLEGVWLFCTGENGKPWFEPSEFKDYAFYIKGTSMIISKHRAALRDSKDAKTKIKEKISYLNNFLRKNWKWYFIDENRINRFRKYFLGITENNINESVIDTNDWSYIMETEEPIEINELETFLESTGSCILRDSIYPYIETTFKTNPTNVRKFNSLVGQFIDRNIDKLTTSGPVYLIPFTDKDKSNYYELFNIEESYIKKIMKEHTAKLNASKFKLLNQNPIFALFYFVIRYFTLHPDKKSLNSALTIYALSAYPSIFTKYFPNGVIEPVMQYTIDNLTDKFLIKKTGHILGLLVESIQHSYTFLKSSMKEAVDVEVIRFIQRIRNDHNSMFKKIMNIYMDNYKNNRGVVLSNTNYDDDTPIIDEVDNATTEVSNAINKVLLPIIQNGVDLVRAEASAKMAGISVSDCRMFLNNIINDKNTDLMQKFIESLLFLYIYEDHKTIRDVRSQYFLRWAASLFKKTNSKNKNINNINEVLNIWAENSGIYAKFHREASRINYKKAIFFYIVLSIQKYIG